MKSKDIEIARIFKDKLRKAVKLVDFIVFGSRARGDADEYSDMDVFIETESLDDKTKNKIKEIAWEIGFENSLHISPIMFSRHELENSPLRVSPIVKNINKEGMRI